MANIDVTALSEKLEQRLGKDQFAIFASAAEFDPTTVDTGIVNIVMDKGKPHIYIDTRDLSLDTAVAVQKKRPVITLVNNTGEEKHFSMLESTTVDGKLTERNLPVGGYLNVEIPPLERETMDSYDRRVDALQQRLEASSQSERFAEVFEMGKKGEANLYSPPANKFGKLYLDVPGEMPEFGKYKPKPEPRAAFRVPFDALLAVPDTWRYNGKTQGNDPIDTVPVENRTMTTDAGAVLVLIDQERIMNPFLDGKRPGYNLMNWELGKPDAYFVAGSASGIYARAGDAGVTPPALFTAPVARNIEMAADIIASMQPERAADFAKVVPSSTYVGRDGVTRVYTPRPFTTDLDGYAVRIASQLRNDGVLAPQDVKKVERTLGLAVARLIGMPINPDDFEGPEGNQQFKERGKEIAAEFLGGHDPKRELPKNHDAVNAYLRSIITNARHDAPFKEHSGIKEKILLGFMEELAYQHFDLEKMGNNKRVAAAGTPRA